MTAVSAGWMDLFLLDTNEAKFQQPSSVAGHAGVDGCLLDEAANSDREEVGGMYCRSSLGQRDDFVLGQKRIMVAQEFFHLHNRRQCT
ncbi:MAG: hypothetical protein ABSE82_12570 [Nitrososphaerales archaeon]